MFCYLPCILFYADCHVKQLLKYQLFKKQEKNIQEPAV